MMFNLTGTVTDSMDDRFHQLSAEQLVEWADQEFDSDLVMSTSFGIQSAVTLHLVTRQRPDIPIIWIDTGYLPQETLDYARTLTERLGLNLHTYRSPITPTAMEERYGRLWESDHVEDLNLYDRLRKVEPMQRALQDLKVFGWISGLRAEQTEYRGRLPRVQRKHKRYRMYPILNWSSRDVYYYMEQHDLPQHPLFYEGYATVGDWHSSRPMTSDDLDERDTRFRGLKQECGIHL